MAKGQTKPGETQFYIRMPAAQRAALMRYATDHGKTVTEVIRETLAEIAMHGSDYAGQVETVALNIRGPEGDMEDLRAVALDLGYSPHSVLRYELEKRASSVG